MGCRGAAAYESLLCAALAPAGLAPAGLAPAGLAPAGLAGAALQGPALARRAWESLSESLVARLAGAAPAARAPHRLGAAQHHAGGGTVSSGPPAPPRPRTSERPHMCPLCPYRATTRDSLARHIRTHTGERPFKCSFCPYRAIQKSDVDKHIRRRHKDAAAAWPPVSGASCLANVMGGASSRAYAHAQAPSTTAAGGWQGPVGRQGAAGGVVTDSFTSPSGGDA
nr:zinc finger protein 513-like [Penaeus vannamei]